MSFKENLKYYRLAAGYRQTKEFAQALNVGYTTYLSYENDGREPKYPLLIKIADLLNVSLDELLGRKNSVLINNDDKKLDQHLKNILKYDANIQIKKIDNNTVCFVLSSVKSIKPILCPVNKSKLIELINKYEIDYTQLKNKELCNFLKIQLLNHTNYEIQARISNLDIKQRSLSKNQIDEKNKILTEIFNLMRVEKEELGRPDYQKEIKDFFYNDRKTVNVTLHVQHADGTIKTIDK